MGIPGSSIYDEVASQNKDQPSAVVNRNEVASPRPMTLQEHLDQLTNIVGLLEDLTSNLIDQIGPVLSPDDDGIVPMKPGPDRPAQSDIANVVDALLERLGNLAARVKRVHQRVEL